MNKVEELRNSSIQELAATLADARKALFNLVNELKFSKKLEKPHLVRAKRKEIARIMTILREKELSE